MKNNIDIENLELNIFDLINKYSLKFENDITIFELKIEELNNIYENIRCENFIFEEELLDSSYDSENDIYYKVEWNIKCDLFINKEKIKCNIFGNAIPDFSGNNNSWVSTTCYIIENIELK